MKYDEFVAQVQRRANLGSRGETELAIRATLETLAERLSGGEPKDLASQLPAEIAAYLQRPYAGIGEGFSLDEFFRRVSERESVDLPVAALHARVVIAVLSESVTMGEIENVRAQLPADIRQLFMVENEGELPEVNSTSGLETEASLVSDRDVDVGYLFPPSKLFNETE